MQNIQNQQEQVAVIGDQEKNTGPEQNQDEEDKCVLLCVPDVVREHSYNHHGLLVHPGPSGDGSKVVGEIPRPGGRPRSVVMSNRMSTSYINIAQYI